MMSYSVDFKAPQELWNPLSEAVPGKFHGSVYKTKPIFIDLGYGKSS